MGVAGHVSGAAPEDGAEASYATARALLERAQADAERARIEADRYVRQREQEAAMLVAKARRVLHAAEEKAAVIIASARSETAGPDATLDLLDGAVDDEEIGRVIAPGAARLGQERHPSHGGASRLDRLLASAITSAVDDTFAGRASA